MANEQIILFDGVCNLCDHTVRFILARDPHRRFRFASLQSAAAAPYLARLGPDLQNLSSMVLLADGQTYTKSDAALRIAAQLAPPWPVFRVFLLVPRPLRNWVYDLIARHRYRWFGKKSACLVPTAELQERFLS